MMNALFLIASLFISSSALAGESETYLTCAGRLDHGTEFTLEIRGDARNRAEGIMNYVGDGDLYASFRCAATESHGVVPRHLLWICREDSGWLSIEVFHRENGAVTARVFENRTSPARVLGELSCPQFL